MSDPSPTNRYEDAEEAREEVEELHGVLVNVLSNASNYPPAVQSRMLGQDTGPLREKVVAAILAAGYTRQSPASTTAADAYTEAIKDAVEWARSCSGESADHAADYIEEMGQQHG